MTLTFLARRDLDPEAVQAVRTAYKRAGGAEAKLTKGRHRVLLEADDMPAVAILTEDQVIERFADASEDEVEVLTEAFSFPSMTGVAVARDAKPVEIRVPDPRAYSLINYAIGTRDKAAAKRAPFVAGLVRERWPEQFEPRQEAAFPGLCIDIEDDVLQVPRI